MQLPGSLMRAPNSWRPPQASLLNYLRSPGCSNPQQAWRSHWKRSYLGSEQQLHNMTRTWQVQAQQSDGHANGKDEPGEGQERPGGSHSEAALLLQSLQQQEIVGSPYGEGFIQYRLSGEALHLDVDTLNERLQLKGAARMRVAMRPDEAYGMIFNWDGVLADMNQVQRRAWKAVAESQDLNFPDVERRIFSVRPERAIMDVLQWTRDWGTAQRLSFELAEAVAKDFETLQEPLPGVIEWLQALRTASVPCAVVTCLDRNSLGTALERMGIAHFFAVRVTAEDGMETSSQRFLSAAIKLARPPSDCVVFESSPGGVTAAHNCTMKAVAVQGPHPGYRLQNADLTCSTLAELNVYNIRRLFANRGQEFMDRNKQTTSSRSHGGNMSRRRVAGGVCDP